jgi:uncharacterized protein YraI
MRASSCLRLSVGAFLITLSFAAMGENAETSEPASVRAGPDSSYPEVAQLDADTPIQVMGCLDDWSWCDVAFDGNRGWLYSPDITYQYQGGYVPLYSYAPGLGVPVLSFSLDSYWGNHYHDRPWYAQRDEWVRRPIHHQRPPGPPPSSSPPPRQAVRMDRPHAGPQSDRSIRLGEAEQSRQDAQRHDDARRHDGNAVGHEGTARPVEPRAVEPRPQERGAQRAEMNSRPPERAPPQEHAAAPQHDEGHSRPSGQAQPQRHEEQHPAADKPEGPPHTD